MSEHNTYNGVGHEETDADIGPLVKFAIFLTVLTLVTAVADRRLLQVPSTAASRLKRRRAFRWRRASSGRCRRRRACRPIRSTT